MQAYYAAFIPQSDGKYAVVFPDVDGCATWGETLEHAFAMAMDALAGHLEALADDGDPIPSPSLKESAWAKLVQNCQDLDIPLPPETHFQIVPGPDLDDKNIRISVSFRKYALDMIDRKAEEEGMTRSGFLAKAASVFSHQQHR